MKICLTCHNYAARCSCKKERKKNIIVVDDDLAPIIIGYNRAFKKLNSSIRTSFCCAGHICYKSLHPDYIPQVYIKFDKSFDFKFDISSFFKDIIKLRFPKNIRIDLDFDLIGIASMKTLGRMTLEDKTRFLKAKYIFFNYLVKKLRQLENCNDKF